MQMSLIKLCNCSYPNYFGKKWTALAGNYSLQDTYWMTKFIDERGFIY